MDIRTRLTIELDLEGMAGDERVIAMQRELSSVACELRLMPGDEISITTRVEAVPSALEEILG